MIFEHLLTSTLADQSQTAVLRCAGEGVGTVYMLPAAVYQSAPAHVPTAFTEHFPVVHHAKYALGLRVAMALDVFAYHADLVRHGEAWHK
jgi:hypothetical protein